MTYLVRWNPNREMRALRNVMNRWFDNSDVLPESAWLRSAAQVLALDVVENENEFLVKASLPGIDPEDLDITYTDGALTIKGEYEEEQETEGQYHLRERRYGSFCRTISLPTTVTSDKIEASYQAGVLTLHLPKDEQSKPRRIPVKGFDSSKVIEGKAADIKNKN